MKQFHHEEFARFKFGEYRLDVFFYDILKKQKIYEDLRATVKFLVTLSYGQAVVEIGF